MANSADPDQLASSKKPTDLDLHGLQRQDISGFSRTRVKYVAVEGRAWYHGHIHLCSDNNLSEGNDSNGVNLTCKNIISYFVVVFMFAFFFILYDQFVFLHVNEQTIIMS